MTLGPAVTYPLDLIRLPVMAQQAKERCWQSQSLFCNHLAQTAVRAVESACALCAGLGWRPFSDNRSVPETLSCRDLM